MPQSIVAAPAALARSLIEHQAAVVFLIPSHLNALLMPLANAHSHARRRKGLNLRHVVCCGEALRPAVVERFYALVQDVQGTNEPKSSGKGGSVTNGAELHNLYGPTEGSMTWERCTEPHPTEILVGTPIDDTVVMLLDGNQRLVPIGVPAEICFGGAIAAGYLGRDDLTAAKFVRNPLDEEMMDPRVPPAPLLYKSGDLAMRLPSGNLRFLGRVDRQVKVRGYRIELEAVETVARSKWDGVKVGGPPVQLAACCSSAGELVLYVTKRSLESATSSLLDHCSQSLPAYSVPSSVLSLETFPTLPNGKINLTALASGNVPGAEVVENSAKVGGNGKRFATDSLGMTRELNSGQAQSQARETAVADVMRAILMYGVIMDHYAGCADGSTCRMVMEDIIWRQPYASQDELKWLDTAVRAIGNYKTMAGFLMVSAYVDSGYANATRWGRGDALTVFAYLQMLWVIDPLVYLICEQVTPEQCVDGYFYYAGVHRWYLLAMLMIKFLLWSLRIARVPPIGQCVLVNKLAWNASPTFASTTHSY